jgi:hypothetical protein
MDSIADYAYGPGVQRGLASLPAGEGSDYVAERALKGQHVLVVEDEILVSMCLELALSEAGAVVIGPPNSLSSALAAIGSAKQLDLTWP